MVRRGSLDDPNPYPNPGVSSLLQRCLLDGTAGLNASEPRLHKSFI
jgi:hypothetical protein